MFVVVRVYGVLFDGPEDGLARGDTASSLGVSRRLAGRHIGILACIPNLVFGRRSIIAHVGVNTGQPRLRFDDAVRTVSLRQFASNVE